MANNYTPCIIVPGIGQSKMELVDDNGKKIKMAWQLDVDTDEIVKRLKVPMVRSIILRQDLGLSKRIKEIIADVVEPVATKEDGTMKNNIRVVEYPKSLANCSEGERNYIYRMVPMQRLSKIIGEDKVYFFAFNSFGEPYETARRLNDFIQQIKAEHNCDKVNLIPVSLGGAMSIAYFDAYGQQNDIKRVLYFVAALQGTSVINDLISMNIQPDKALSLIEFLFPRTVAESLGKILGLLPKKVSDKLMTAVMEGILENVVQYCPALWGTVLPNEYERLAQTRIGDANLKTLREKTDRFNKAQKNFPEYVKTLEAQGTKFFAIVGYNLQLLPIIKSDTVTSDGMIDTASASLGATTAPLGQTLGKEPDNDYISPDGTIDASTSVWKDAVWYFRNQQHDDTAYNDTALDIAAKAMSDDSFVSVYSDPAYPRYGNASDNRKK